MGGVKVTMEVGSDGVAVITIFNPPVNALAIPSKLIPLYLFRFHLMCLDWILIRTLCIGGFSYRWIEGEVD